MAILLWDIYQFLEPVMYVVRWIGAGYLIYLGVMQFRLSQLELDSSNQIPTNTVKQFLMGFLLGEQIKSNFILSFFYSLFLDLSNISLMTGIQIILTVYFSVFASLVVVCGAGNQIKSWVTKPSAAKRLNQITGSVMVLVDYCLWSHKKACFILY